ncbi:MAG TPA: PhzF family phenazine biosynthesis protein [Solirubrobacteraceae bacterium]|nr:PhzF family phenazine biosynthesis protein [Solirubrobacteraceae bacterium]
MDRPFRQVDVFGSGPYSGNPVAVVLDGRGLSDEDMQRFANWTNLSETTFVLPADDPEADYRLRIFTPVAELPFAGHPTLGSAQAWLGSGGSPRRPNVVVQECGAGLVKLRPTADRVAFEAPPMVRSAPVDEDLVEELAAVFGIDHAAIADSHWVDNGPGWVALLLSSADDVLAVRPGFVERSVGLVGPYPPEGPAAIEVRAFFPTDDAMVEDPVTGSLNASVAQWLLSSGRATAPYVASQGTVLGRAGRVFIEEHEGSVWVGGAAVTCVEGSVEL